MRPDNFGVSEGPREHDVPVRLECVRQWRQCVYRSYTGLRIGSGSDFPTLGHRLHLMGRIGSAPELAWRVVRRCAIRVLLTVSLGRDGEIARFARSGHYFCRKLRTAGMSGRISTLQCHPLRARTPVIGRRLSKEPAERPAARGPPVISA